MWPANNFPYPSDVYLIQQFVLPSSTLPVILPHCAVFRQLFFFCFLFLLFRAAFPVGHLVCTQTEGDTHTQSDTTQQSNLSHHGRGKATGACDETDKAEFSIHSACFAVIKKEKPLTQTHYVRPEYSMIKWVKRTRMWLQTFFSQSLYSGSSTTEILWFLP